MRQCAQSLQNFYCASINYSFGLKVRCGNCKRNDFQTNIQICILNGGNLHLNGGDTLVGSREFDYFENTCQPRSTTTTGKFESSILRSKFPNFQNLRLEVQVLRKSAIGCIITQYTTHLTRPLLGDSRIQVMPWVTVLHTKKNIQRAVSPSALGLTFVVVRSVLE